MEKSAIKYFKKYPFGKKSIKKIKNSPGVYIFWKQSTPIYIGKAKNLRNRLISYTQLSLYGKTKKLMENTKYFSVLYAISELDSLLLEANLVGHLKPFFNIQLKDDKSPIYIHISADEYPIVKLKRKTELRGIKGKVYGPFISSTKVKSLLKTLRKIFPYAEHNIQKRGCLYSQIGLCNPCPSLIERSQNKKEIKLLKQKYRNNIKMLKAVLGTNINSFLKKLLKKMEIFSKEELYEEANELKNIYTYLEIISKPKSSPSQYLDNPNLAEDIRRMEIKVLIKLLNPEIILNAKKLRIECYDIAHISGYFPSASMVTFIDGESDKKYYRHFKIKQKKGTDDIASMKEIAERRIKYLDSWGKPDLIIVDGGKAQINAFLAIYNEKRIPVIGLAKHSRTLIVPVFKMDMKKFKVINLKNSPAANLLERIRDEAHRFARRYHNKMI